MNWDEFCEFRTPDIAWAASRMNSNIYIWIMERTLVEKEGELWSAEFVFQHGKRLSTSWFRGKNIGIIGSIMSDVFIDLLNILMFW